MGQGLDAAVHEVAGDGHDVGLHLVGASDDLLDELLADEGAHVQVRELYDYEAIALGGPAGKRDVHVLARGPPDGAADGEHRQATGGQGHPAGGHAPEEHATFVTALGSVVTMAHVIDEGEDVGEQAADEQQEAKAHPHVAGAGDPARLVGRLARREKQTGGQAHGGQHDEGREDRAPGRRP